MENKEAEYDLYKKWAGICEDIDSYNNIVASGIVPSDLKEVFQGSFSNFSGTYIISKIVEKGEKVFLHASDRTMEFKASYAYFFYRDFMVVVPVGRYDVQQGEYYKYNHYKYNLSICKPVIIQLSKLQNVSFEKKRYAITEDCWEIRLEFKQGGSVKVGLCRTAPFKYSQISDKYLVDADNWSFQVNRNLFNSDIHLFSGDEFAIQIVEKIKSLMQNSRNYDGIANGIKRCFDEEKVNELMPLRFNLNELSKKLIMNMNFCKDQVLHDMLKDSARYFDDADMRYVAMEKDKNNAQSEYANASLWSRRSKKAKLDAVISEMDELEADIIAKMGKIYSYLENMKPISSKSHVKKQSNVKNTERRRMLGIVQYQEEKNSAEIIGIDKYVRSTSDKAKKADEKVKSMEYFEELAVRQTQKQATKSNPAIWGGLASGIAGNAVGLMIASDIQSENIKAEQRAAEIRNQGWENLSTAMQMKRKYSNEADSYARSIRKLKNRKIDIDNQKYFSVLNCKVVKWEVIADDVIRIEAKIASPPYIAMNGIHFTVDGSIQVVIKHDGKEVGDAYICGDGDNDVSISKAGFTKEQPFVAIGVLKQKVDLDNLQFVFKPYHLWAIEQ